MFGKKLNKAAFAAAIATAIGGVAVTDANAQAVGTFKGTPEFVDGDFKFKVRGRVQYDIYSLSTDLSTGPTEEYTRSGLRRARLGVEGQFNKKFKYKAEATLLGQDGAAAADADNQVQWEDLFVEYVASNFSIVVGNHKAVAPLEEATSSRFITFNERSGLINAFGFGRQAGLAVIGGGANYSWGVAIQGDSVNSTETVGDESITQTARLTFAPIMEKSPDSTTILHLGATLRHRDDGDDGDFRYRARPAGAGFNTRFIDTGAVGREDTYYGAEAALVLGPFSLQGEYGQLQADVAAGEGDLKSYYVDAMWNITGEARSYKGNVGQFDRLTPANPLENGGMGAWQVALRYEDTDLIDGAINGGEQSAWTAGLHWYPTAYVGFKLNYGRTQVDAPAKSGTDYVGDVDVISLRTQFDF